MKVRPLRFILHAHSIVDKKFDFILLNDYTLTLRSARVGGLCVPLQLEGCTFIEEFVYF